MKTLVWTLPLALLTTSAFACPDLNGTFESREGGSTRTVQISTREAGGAYSYRLGAGSDFLPADGKAHVAFTEGNSGSVRVSCESDAVLISSKPEGSSAVEIRIARVSAKKIRVSTEGASGVFKLVRN